MSEERIGDKLMTAREAVERFIPDGAQIALGGFTINRNPMALAREIVRQGKKDLHLVCHSHGQAMDLLVGAGCVKRIEIAYAGSGRFAPTSIRFRKAVQEGALEVEDYSNFQMSLRFLGGSLGLPFMPAKTGFETDLVKKQGFSESSRTEPKVANKKMLEMENPFDSGRDKVLLLPSLTPDVALVHAQYVGDDGTARIKGLTFADVEQARAAKTLIVSCEEIVPAEHLRQDPDQNQLPHFLVDAVVKAPYGAHPTACHFFYDYHPQHLWTYKKNAGNDRAFMDYLQEWVFGISDEHDYLEKVGISELLTIKASRITGYAPGLDRR
ncbi:CoA transferase subunit A [Dethiosulfatarculus sandiegensis]|uniref:Glutaconate CoA-transferase subunit A n=1 Tax=Dethiosulfatarculus sandiegensis TaxID=1429043 RepID=A0A0D2J7P7_9BACT|nr:CoA-transferase [Dethiosulfatarculus sandiegensis]KIX14234.1 glutaconate CoA-transferase subunit A [Dethiosulfatarculus sandiegensis]